MAQYMFLRYIYGIYGIYPEHYLNYFLYTFITLGLCMVTFHVVGDIVFRTLIAKNVYGSEIL